MRACVVTKILSILGLGAKRFLKNMLSNDLKFWDKTPQNADR